MCVVIVARKTHDITVESGIDLSAPIAEVNEDDDEFDHFEKKDILRTIDTLGIYTTERSQGIKPFLLLDGHGSRLSMEFLDYINDEDHEWVVCLGVQGGRS